MEGGYRRERRVFDDAWLCFLSVSVSVSCVGRGRGRGGGGGEGGMVYVKTSLLFTLSTDGKRECMCE